MLTSNVQFGNHCPRGGGKLSRLVYLVPRPGYGSSVNYLGILSCMSYKHYFGKTEMFTSNAQFGYLCPSCGRQGTLPTSPPHSGFGSGSVISQFLLHHNLGIFSCKRCEHYFSQTDMITSNIQFCYPCPMVGGQADQAGLSCPLLA